MLRTSIDPGFDSTIPIDKKVFKWEKIDDNPCLMTDILWELQSNGRASFSAKGSHSVYNQSRTWVLERVALLNKSQGVEDTVDNFVAPGRPYLLDMPYRNTQYSLYGSGVFDPKVYDQVVAMQMVVRWAA